eukprot:gnl/TRDRNA2_/TRDRNA2_143211_c2_seq2.p1 gnl/TRDRNA2_/TRDRNA2_143211_c2~~gnl/TRDRNA2_/TRDRNA2_143211_c2_seq2.p1  ORF type:complete len:371 (+),score=50.09 gnl/TRDRNA2_/TRDRNA2_143211_c2_seq2:163-1113(+)
MALDGTGAVNDRNLRYKEEFRKNTPHILIATAPMAEFVISRSSRTVSLVDLKAVVLDEVDLMLSMKENREGAMYVLAKAQARNAQKILVSATITEDVKKVAENYLNLPKTIGTSNVQAAASKMPDSLQHWYFLLEYGSQDYKIRKLVELHNALSKRRKQVVSPHVKVARHTADISTILVFVKDPAVIPTLVYTLRTKHGLRIKGLGTKSTKAHYQVALNMVVSGRLDMLVGTDVLARGMDMFGVTDVVNFDAPKSKNMYLHRAGRAGRLQGKFKSDSHVISFVDRQDEQVIKGHIRSLGGNVKRVWIYGNKIKYGG